MKKEINLELLKDMYCNRNMTCKDIGKIFNMNEKTVGLRVKEYNLIRNYNNKDWLIEQHHVNKLRCYKMADICCCSIDAILDNMRKFSIDIYNYNRKYTLDEDFFSVIDTEEKAYWLGFIMADGYVTKSYASLRVRLSAVDCEHIKKLACSLKSEHPIQYVIGKIGDKEYDMCQIDINSVKMCNDLKNNGVLNCKSNNEIMPIIDCELQRHFIRGYFDGDGCLTYGRRAKYNTRYCSFSLLGGVSLLSDISRIINNIFSEIDMNVKRKGTENINKISCSDTKAIKVLNWLYKDSTIYLNRKKIKFANCISELDYKI